MIICGKCKTVNEDYANFCKECGNWINPNIQTKNTEFKPTEENNKDLYANEVMIDVSQIINNPQKYKLPHEERKVFFSNSDDKKIELILNIYKNDLMIPEIDFLSVSSVQSHDGKYILATQDEYFILDEKNNQRVGGKTVFIAGDRLFLIDDIERPNDGNLADNGNFIVNDWMHSQKLCGTFYAFNSEAEILIKRKFYSNLGKNIISTSGRYAAVETYFSDSNDQNKIFFFDLNNRKLLWGKERSAGNIKEFEFDEDNSILLISYQKGGRYRYNFKGEFLDQNKFMKERILFANGYELYDIAKEKMNDLDYEFSNFKDYKEVLLILKKATNEDISDYTKARVYRILGEIYYNFNKTDKAMYNFEKALFYNPNVGVKRLYGKLKSSI